MHLLDNNFIVSFDQDEMRDGLIVLPSDGVLKHFVLRLSYN